MRRAFSLIELLITFALLAVMASLIIPRYINLQRQATIQVATQQSETLRRAVLAWCAAQSSLSAADVNYGQDNSGQMKGSALKSAAAYLDGKFSDLLIVNGPSTPSVYVSNNAGASPAPSIIADATLISKVQTPEMINIDSNNCYATILWPTGNRRNTQPAVNLVLP